MGAPIRTMVRLVRDLGFTLVAIGMGIRNFLVKWFIPLHSDTVDDEKEEARPMRRGKGGGLISWWDDELFEEEKSGEHVAPAPPVSVIEAEAVETVYSRQEQEPSFPFMGSENPAPTASSDPMPPPPPESEGGRENRD